MRREVAETVEEEDQVDQIINLLIQATQDPHMRVPAALGWPFTHLGAWPSIEGGTTELGAQVLGRVSSTLYKYSVPVRHIFLEPSSVEMSSPLSRHVHVTMLCAMSFSTSVESAFRPVLA